MLLSIKKENGATAQRALSAEIYAFTTPDHLDTSAYLTGTNSLAHGFLNMPLAALRQHSKPYRRL